MIPKRSWCRYDGEGKWLTKECREDCNWYRKIGCTEYCGWGEHFKILLEGEKKIACEVKNRKVESPHHFSVIYIDEMIEKLRNQRFQK